MELSWSTFVLELINFVVLVWILQRFLYRPVLEVIAKRRADIEKTLADAGTLQTEAKALQDRYENRLADWDAERRRTQDDLAREIEQERATKLDELRAALDAEREKARAAENRRLEDIRAQLEEAALAHGARFAARLLEPLAGPDLDSRLFDLLVKELSSLSPEQLASLRAPAEQQREILVSSARVLSKEQRARLERVLGKVARTDGPVEFEQDPALLAGLRVTIGAFALGMNLKDELDGFVKSAHERS